MSDGLNIPTALQQLISAEQAYHYRIIPEAQHNGSIRFKTDAASKVTLAQELEIVLGKHIELIDEDAALIQKALDMNYRKKTSSAKSQLYDSSELLLTIIHEAKALGSSDIHFEIFEHSQRVRFRIDGKLLERFTIPLKEYPKIINQIKVKAGLDIAEKRLPQDGRIKIQTQETDYDIRVSSLPTLYGEKLVLRLLSKDTTNVKLEALGFTALELERYTQGAKHEQGIVLISGPTGSGKTTTLYATLKKLNTESVNILTIEDPIEYTLEGINQVQLKEAIGLDFAKSLRTFLRQDPNIIMVGEIRDVATANMAIRASLTGHLVLSTIHTNSAWATISRLIDMGIPPFLIANTLKLSVAQRLVRKLCDACKKEETLVEGMLPKQFDGAKELKKHWTAVGCEQCYHTGYSGRRALYEILPVTRALTEAIKSNRLEIDSYMKQEGIASLRENAMALVQSGQTSIEEVYSLLMS